MDGRRPGQSGLLRGGNWMQRDQWEHIRARPGSERTIFGTPVPGSLLESLGRLRSESEPPRVEDPLQGIDWMRGDQWSCFEPIPGTRLKYRGIPAPGSALEAALARRAEREASRALYVAQRRQALTAILAGLAIMALAVIAMRA